MRIDLHEWVLFINLGSFFQQFVREGGEETRPLEPLVFAGLSFHLLRGMAWSYMELGCCWWCWEGLGSGLGSHEKQWKVKVVSMQPSLVSKANGSWTPLKSCQPSYDTIRPHA